MLNTKHADCVVLTTNHDAFDVDFIQQHSQMIVDMRNMVKETNDKVYKLLRLLS
jgi:UDP-N-acetyl-D-glucosamine dehydrogenase